MNMEMIQAFGDELQKIAASLSTAQMQQHAAKALKRGWSPARESKSVMRLLSRDSRPAAAAASKANKTVSQRAPKALTASHKVEDTLVRPAASAKKNLKKTVGLGTIGVGGFGFGLGTGHRPQHQIQPAGM